MTDAIYPKYKEALLSGATDVALDSSNVVVSLVDGDVQTFSITDEYYSDLDANSIIGEASLSNKSVNNGLFDADPVEIQITSNNSAEALLLWINTGSTDTSRLVAWLDDSVVGLPTPPDDPFVDINWNELGIFKL